MRWGIGVVHGSCSNLAGGSSHRKWEQQCGYRNQDPKDCPCKTPVLLEQYLVLFAIGKDAALKVV
jgi:hypothetical protein